MTSIAEQASEAGRQQPVVATNRVIEQVLTSITEQCVRRIAANERLVAAMLFQTQRTGGIAKQRSHVPSWFCGLLSNCKARIYNF